MIFPRLLLATGNRNKYREFLQLLPREVAGELVFAPDVAPLEVEETGGTYAGNALQKSMAWAEAAGLPALADDSGIEVRALSWGPGVYSARAVAGSDADRRRWLLSRMKCQEDRAARFVAAVALTVPANPKTREGKWMLICEGICDGRLGESEQGDGGFGYDPLFVPDGCDASFAELPFSVKNKISHRARATTALLEKLSRF